MKHVLTFFSLISFFAFTQEEVLPIYLTEEEKLQLSTYEFSTQETRGITTPPQGNIRTMAEWEEIEYLLVTWVPNFSRTLTDIVRAAVNECKVLIITNNPSSVANTLGNANVSLSNVEFVERGYNTIWIRDYAANSVYKDWNDSLILVDWIYNRPRPLDNSAPEAYAEQLGIPLYQMTEAPTDIIGTGGNFMSDGFGTGFASMLIMDENGPGNNFSVTPKSEEDVDNIFGDFMGLSRYIKMENLPYDAIDHIDMHMKLLDEETLIVSEYPEGVADGPQIEANLQYVLSNYNSVYDTPYRVIRIPAPPSTQGLHPDQNAHYRNYANQVFVNNTVIVPFYREEYDTIARRVLENAMPGYNIVGVNVDGQGGETLIAQGGAIHCITHAVGVQDPMIISHQRLRDTYETAENYVASAYLSHRSGIASATLYYKTDEAEAYESVEMTDVGDENWEAEIPAQSAGTDIYYYIQASSEDGKTRTRPMPAPEGYWKFKVLGEGDLSVTEETMDMDPIYPNPASAITAVPFSGYTDEVGTVSLIDAQGRTVQVIHEGDLSGEQIFFFNASLFSKGVYHVKTASNRRLYNQRVVIQ